MSTNAIIAVQGKTGWQYTHVHYDGNTIGPLLARWYKDIGKARQLVRYERIESLPSDPALINSEQLDEPETVLKKEEVYGVRRFCDHYYFLADKPKSQWVYSRGPSDKGAHTVKPGKIPDYRIWVDVRRSKGSIFINVYFGKEKVMEIGPEKMGYGDFGQIRQAMGLGEKLYEFMQQADFLQEGGRPAIQVLGNAQKIFSRMQKRS